MYVFKRLILFVSRLDSRTINKGRECSEGTLVLSLLFWTPAQEKPFYFHSIILTRLKPSMYPIPLYTLRFPRVFSLQPFCRSTRFSSTSKSWRVCHHLYRKFHLLGISKKDQIDNQCDFTHTIPSAKMFKLSKSRKIPHSMKKNFNPFFVTG